METPDLYSAHFHESSNRPHLMLGCEPTALALVLVLSTVIGYSVPAWWGIEGAIFLFLFLRQVLRAMAKEDARMLSLHSESQRYNQGFWTAKRTRAPRWRSK